MLRQSAAMTMALITKAVALRRLEAVLREVPELSKELQRKIAHRLESEVVSLVN